jgi:hypothetical protein
MASRGNDAGRLIRSTRTIIEKVTAAVPSSEQEIPPPLHAALGHFLARAQSHMEAVELLSRSDRCGPQRRIILRAIIEDSINLARIAGAPSVDERVRRATQFRAFMFSLHHQAAKRLLGKSDEQRAALEEGWAQQRISRPVLHDVVRSSEDLYRSIREENPRLGLAEWSELNRGWDGKKLEDRAMLVDEEAVARDDPWPFGGLYPVVCTYYPALSQDVHGSRIHDDAETRHRQQGPLVWELFVGLQFAVTEGQLAAFGLEQPALEAEARAKFREIVAFGVKAGMDNGSMTGEARG